MKDELYAALRAGLKEYAATPEEELDNVAAHVWPLLLKYSNGQE